MTECRFGFLCKRRDCHFQHPHGRNIDITPSQTMCRFGTTQQGCQFLHEHSRMNPGSETSQTDCKFGVACSRPDCRFIHSPASTSQGGFFATYRQQWPQCKFGDACTKAQCQYLHPPAAARQQQPDFGTPEGEEEGDEEGEEDCYGQDEDWGGQDGWEMDSPGQRSAAAADHEHFWEADPCFEADNWEQPVMSFSSCPKKGSLLLTKVENVGPALIRHLRWDTFKRFINKNAYCSHVLLLMSDLHIVTGVSLGAVSKLCAK